MRNQVVSEVGGVNPLGAALNRPDGGRFHQTAHSHHDPLGECVDTPLQFGVAKRRRSPQWQYRREAGEQLRQGRIILPGRQLESLEAISECRRNYVEVAANFATECQYVLETLGKVYGTDEEARRLKLAGEERLAYHQTHSGPLMEQLRQWGQQQLDEHKVEANSGLGQAITYMLKHWEKLTLFLRHPGAPLDSNIVERALKKAILHRKNALFYRTRNGARVGDLFMSLIHTCESCGGNPFDYLTELQRHAAEVSLNPTQWMPWNYRATLMVAAVPADQAA